MTRLSDKELIDELLKRFNEKDTALNQVRQTTQELKEVNAKLKESEALKSHFISNITNEIVNPFTSILGLARNILNLKENQWERMQSMVKLIYFEAFNLDFQLKNIFAAAEIEAGETSLNPSRVDLNQIIQAVLDNYQESANKKKVELVLESELPMPDDQDYNYVTDPVKIQLIVSNLLDNAIKFSDEPGQITLTLAKKQAKLELTVTDQGIGISKENQQTIYDRFRQYDSGLQTPHRGHGLGLSIVKALVDMLDGTIQFDTQVKKGTRFTLIIPEATPSETDDFSTHGNDIFFGDTESF